MRDELGGVPPRPPAGDRPWTPEERDRLAGHIQALLRKDVLTRERLGDRLRDLGLPLPAAPCPGRD